MESRAVTQFPHRKSSHIYPFECSLRGVARNIMFKSGEEIINAKTEARRFAHHRARFSNGVAMVYLSGAVTH
jgi:hypothetical protein